MAHLLGGEVVKPRLLDLFCCAGGAGMGYHRAGFEVVGVDIDFQPNYPFEFHQADALTFPIEGFDAVHASPPCQFYAGITGASRSKHQDLIAPTRELLEDSGLPYVIENVEDAASHLRDPVMICGTMFDPVMEVRRHRLFEANWPLRHPDWGCRHKLSEPRFDVYEHGEWRKRRFLPVYGMPLMKASEHWAQGMGIDWMTEKELTESIPPAYTEFIGEQLMAHVLAEREAPRGGVR